MSFRKNERRGAAVEVSRMVVDSERCTNTSEKEEERVGHYYSRGPNLKLGEGEVKL